MTNATSTIKKLAAECVREARSQGFEGTYYGTYYLTAQDCDWITEQLGRKPSRAEWVEAGFHHIGSRHVSESDAARALRAIPSETRSQASRENGKRGGRPRKKLETPCQQDHSGNHEMVYGGKMSGRPYYQCSGCGQIKVLA